MLPDNGDGGGGATATDVADSAAHHRIRMPIHIFHCQILHCSIKVVHHRSRRNHRSLLMLLGGHTRTLAR